MPLHPVEFPRRPGISLRILSTHGESHRVSLADVTANHTLVRDVLPHFALQIRLDPQPAQWVRSLRPRLLEWWRRCIESREVRPRAWQSLQRRRQRGRLERGRGKWRARGDGGRGRRRKEGRNGSQLRRGEVAYTTGVVDLQAGADAAGRVATDPIEVSQRVLKGVSATPWRRKRD